MTETLVRRAGRIAVQCTPLALALVLGACTSEALDNNAGSGGAGGAASAKGGSSGASGTTHSGGNGSGCSAALRQAITLVDKVTPGNVTLLGETAGEKLIYVDASTGGIGGQDIQPWVYLSLRTGKRVDLTDLEALNSTVWDLALKRAVLRTNSGDSGPGAGGAARVMQSYTQLSAANADTITLEVETWFDSDCTLLTDVTGAVLTTFADWSLYDETTHQLTPAPWPYVVRGADGALYKLAILDYYSKPDGSSGASDGGHYKLRAAALE
jgi:hypothetical protein